MGKIFAPCFYGQGGIVTSFGVYLIARRLRALGIEAETYRYRADYNLACENVNAKTKAGYSINPVGYSLGCSAATLLQCSVKCDLVICIAESSLAINYPINHKNTRHSVLIHGPDFLSDAGTHLGFDEKFYTPLLHLMIDFDPGVTKIIMDEFVKLIQYK